MNVAKKSISGMLCMVWALGAHAGEATLTWTYNDTCADGTSASIFCPTTGFRIYAAPCANPVRDLKTTVPPDARRHTVTNLIPELWCFSVTTLAGGMESVHSADTEKSRKRIESIQPAPPAEVTVQPAAIAVIPAQNDTAMTPVYRVNPDGTRARDVAGFVPIGTACIGKVLFSYKRLAFRRVPQTAVDFWRVTPTAQIAAACG